MKSEGNMSKSKISSEEVKAKNRQIMGRLV